MAKKAAPVTQSASTIEPPQTKSPPVTKTLPAQPAVGAEHPSSRAGPIAPTPPPADLHPATHAEITHLANTMWAQGAPGGPLDHWLAAERQLLCK